MVFGHVCSPRLSARTSLTTWLMWWMFHTHSRSRCWLERKSKFANLQSPVAAPSLLNTHVWSNLIEETSESTCPNWLKCPKSINERVSIRMLISIIFSTKFKGYSSALESLESSCLHHCSTNQTPVKQGVCWWSCHWFCTNGASCSPCLDGTASPTQFKLLQITYLHMEFVLVFCIDDYINIKLESYWLNTWSWWIWKVTNSCISFSHNMKGALITSWFENYVTNSGAKEN